MSRYTPTPKVLQPHQFTGWRIDSTQQYHNRSITLREIFKWLKRSSKFPSVRNILCALHIEVILYLRAPSEYEYMDKSNLFTRAKAIVLEHVSMNNKIIKGTTKETLLADIDSTLDSLKRKKRNFDLAFTQSMECIQHRKVLLSEDSQDQEQKRNEA